MQTSTLKLNINKSQINNKKSVYKISTKLSHHRLIHLVDNWSPTFFDMRLTFIFILYKKIFSLHDSRILLIIKKNCNRIFDINQNYISVPRSSLKKMVEKKKLITIYGLHFVSVQAFDTFRVFHFIHMKHQIQNFVE